MPTARGAIPRVAFCLAVSLGSSADADSVSSRSNSALFRSQLSVLDGRASQQYSNSTRLRPPSADNELAGLLIYTGGYSGPYLQLARDAARQHGVPEALFLRLVHQESRWNPQAVSNKGAIGLGQLMPATAATLGVDPRNPAQNLDGAARYLRRQYDAFGTWRLALAAYNAGPEAVRTFDGVPPYRETQNYILAILGS